MENFTGKDVNWELVIDCIMIGYDRDILFVKNYSMGKWSNSLIYQHTTARELGIYDLQPIISAKVLVNQAKSLFMWSKDEITAWAPTPVITVHSCIYKCRTIMTSANPHINNIQNRLLDASICVGMGCVSANSMGTSVTAPLMLKGTQLLEQHMLPSRRHLSQGHPSLFQQDNTRPYSAHLATVTVALEWKLVRETPRPVLYRKWHIMTHKVWQWPWTVDQLKWSS